MMDNSRHTDAEGGIPLSLLERLDRAGDRFEDAWSAGALPAIEAYLAESSEPERALLLRELLRLELLFRRRGGETPQPADYLSRFPEHTAVIHEVFAEAPAGTSQAEGADAAGRVTPPQRGSTPVAGRPASASQRTVRDGSEPPGDSAAPGEWPAVPGYEILGELGKGGMGVVYRARHRGLERVVALKMIRAGAQAGAEDLARFRSEAALQAQLQHPNVVQIFEVGEADGCPYFALECVDGASLDKRIAGTPQPPRAAAQLVETLARAVQQAHDKGLVHRDLKPANILLQKSEMQNSKSEKGSEVSDFGFRISDFTPKVSDFGLAKRLEGEAGQTQTGAVVGTPSYLAPEQAWGRLKEIGPATDVYALGTILYELLTGRPPFKGATTLDTVMQVRHQEPVAPRHLLVSVPRDLETICLKCLHKDPAKRYARALDLADDLRRFQTGEPIRARPVSVWERGIKWARRQPAVAALLGVVVLVLFGGTAAGVWYGKHERERADRERALHQDAEGQRELAEKHEAQTRAVLRFFQERVLAAARPKGQHGGLGKNTTIRVALDAAEPAIAEAFPDQPGLEASVRDALGLTYLYLAEYEAAVKQIKQALTFLRQDRGPTHPDTLSSLNNLAATYLEMGRPADALPLFEEILREQQVQRGPDHPETLGAMNNLAATYQAMRRLPDAVPLYEEVLKRCKAKLGPNHPDTLRGMNNLAGAYRNTGRLADAVTLLEDALKSCKASLSPDHPNTLTVMGNLAAAYQQANRMADALPLYEETLARSRAQLGPNHRDTLRSMNNLARAYTHLGRPADAVPLLQEVLARCQNQFDPDHPLVLAARSNLYRAFLAARQPDEAIPVLREFLDGTRHQLGQDSAGVAATLASAGQELLKYKQYAEAEKALRECLTIREAKLPDDWSTSNAKSLLGASLIAQHKYAEAEPLLRAGYEGLKARAKAIPPQGKIRLVEALERLVQLYDAWGKPEQAAAWRQQLEQAKPPVAKANP